MLSTERAGHIAAAIEKLPDRQRAVFTMCHVADQSTSEVSQALGLSEATVRVHLFRAVRKLRKLLASERISRTTTTQFSGSDIQAADAGIGGNEVGGMSHPHLSDDRLIEICFDLEVTSSDRAASADMRRLRLAAIEPGGHAR